MTKGSAKRKNSAIGTRSFGAYASLRSLGLSHNLGSVPYYRVCSISIVGLDGA
jgi:hypothetical protein